MSFDPFAPYSTHPDSQTQAFPEQPYGTGQFQPSQFNHIQPGQFQSPPFYQPPFYPQRPAKKGFLTRRVEVPMWAIIVSGLFCFLLLYSAIGWAVKASSNLPPENNTATSQSSMQANQTTTQTAVVSSSPTTGPTAKITPASKPSPTTTTAVTPRPTTTHRPTQTPRPSPTHAPQWTTIQSFSGNGTKNTTTFSVPDSWRLVWSCDPASFSGQYNLIVHVNAPDGSIIDFAVNTICKAGNTGDWTQEYQGGTIYLEVISEAAWSIQVQVLQ